MKARRCGTNGGPKEGRMESHDLPAEIVQPLMQLGRVLVTHARAHRDSGLDQHEQGMLAAWRGAAPALLEAVLQMATSGLQDNARPIAARCPGCQQRRSVQSPRGRQVQTRLGPIRLRRWWHHCWACARGWSPPDQALPYQHTSTGLARWRAALGAVTTFREAAKLLAELAGVQVGSETLRTQAERIGTEFEGQQRTARTSKKRTNRQPTSMRRRPACWWLKRTG
jgi:hypothetical protein